MPSAFLLHSRHAFHLQVLVATSTLAWGVNTPAHLVIIKGTEYYDAPSRRYVDFPITDVLQVRQAPWQRQLQCVAVHVHLLCNSSCLCSCRCIFKCTSHD